MDRVEKITGIRLEISKEEVLKILNCPKGCAAYDAVSVLYDEVIEEAEAALEPVILYRFGEVEDNCPELPNLRAGIGVIYGISSVGHDICKMSTEAFQGGDPLAGMMFDAIADAALSCLEQPMEEALREACAIRKVGIKKRLEAPQEIPMEAQKLIWNQTEAYEQCGIEISSGYMLHPVKSSANLFVLTGEEGIFHAGHNCRACPRTDCPFRKEEDIHVIVHSGGTAVSCVVAKGESLLTALARQKIFPTSVCGGRGTCGKCRVKVVDGSLGITGDDKRFFSEKELNEGWRLTCRALPTGDLEIELDIPDEKDYEILGRYNTAKYENQEHNQEQRQDKAVICIDIGTTTLAFQMIDMRNGQIIHTCTGLNGQRIYGADVISRIKASCEGKKEELQECIRKDLDKGIEQLMSESGRGREQVGYVALAGNMAMIHFLMGYPCDTLGVAPFKPYRNAFLQGSSGELTGLRNLDVPATVFPGISGYVGGDIVSGLLHCGFDRSEKVSMLIDLGTNGELAIGNREKILVTSTAAGPAFEGGNISRGTGSVAGAICGVEIREGGPLVSTIMDHPPTGICGTGVIETVSELLEHEIIDETGAMEDRYFETGYVLAKDPQGEPIAFTRHDVRELMLAKAAIRAGIEVLMKEYGISAGEVDKVWLSGGFGFGINISKAVSIGIFPKEFEDKIELAGNSSLGGIHRYLSDSGALQGLERILQNSSEVQLGGNPEFNNRFIEEMCFETE